MNARYDKNTFYIRVDAERFCNFAFDQAPGVTPFSEHIFNELDKLYGRISDTKFGSRFKGFEVEAGEDFSNDLQKFLEKQLELASICRDQAKFDYAKIMICFALHSALHSQVQYVFGDNQPTIKYPKSFFKNGMSLNQALANVLERIKANDNALATCAIFQELKSDDENIVDVTARWYVQIVREYAEKNPLLAKNGRDLLIMLAQSNKTSANVVGYISQVLSYFPNAKDLRDKFVDLCEQQNKRLFQFILEKNLTGTRAIHLMTNYLQSQEMLLEYDVANMPNYAAIKKSIGLLLASSPHELRFKEESDVSVYSSSAPQISGHMLEFIQQRGQLVDYFNRTKQLMARIQAILMSATWNETNFIIMKIDNTPKNILELRKLLEPLAKVTRLTDLNQMAAQVYSKLKEAKADYPIDKKLQSYCDECLAVLDTVYIVPRAVTTVELLAVLSQIPASERLPRASQQDLTPTTPESESTPDLISFDALPPQQEKSARP